jgi:hypothetical protein
MLRSGCPPGSLPDQSVPPLGDDGQREGVSDLHEEADQAAYGPVDHSCPTPGAEAGGCPEGPEAGTAPSRTVQPSGLRQCAWSTQLPCGHGEGPHTSGTERFKI